MNERKLKSEHLIALFLAGCLLFNYPLLALFSQDGLVGGIPLLYVYIFITWAVLIGLLAVIIER
ncbi:MAG: hypothetical protein HS126_36715 [Anaerolineales bacterium]|nr:hypothetical protein [Anaerolineales bacterium]